jgi:MotA/TolQ/ExbB proton channel family
MTTIALLQNPGVFTEVSKRFNEGGPFFMSLILICLMLALVFLVLGFLNKKKDINKSRKMIGLASDVSILGLVFGLLGSIIGMISAFDAIGAIGDVSTSIIAGGLKVSLLTTVFGSVTFILPRIGIIILKGLQKS